jgi:hypothetical protein
MKKRQKRECASSREVYNGCEFICGPPVRLHDEIIKDRHSLILIHCQVIFYILHLVI